MGVSNQPRAEGGRFGEKIEVGVQRRLTEALRRALGHDGTDAPGPDPDDLGARFDAQLDVAEDLDMAVADAAPADVSELLVTAGKSGKPGPVPGTPVILLTGPGGRAYSDSAGLLWTQPAEAAYPALAGSEDDLEAYDRFRAFIDRHGLVEPGSDTPALEAPVSVSDDLDTRLAAQEKAWAEEEEKVRKFDADKHPRDWRGRFATIGSTVSLPDSAGGGEGRVVAATGSNHVRVRKADGTEIDVDAKDTEVTASAAANAARDSFQRAGQGEGFDRAGAGASVGTPAAAPPGGVAKPRATAPNGKPDATPAKPPVASPTPTVPAQRRVAKGDGPGNNHLNDTPDGFDNSRRRQVNMRQDVENQFAPGDTVAVHSTVPGNSPREGTITAITNTGITLDIGGTQVEEPWRRISEVRDGTPKPDAKPDAAAKPARKPVADRAQGGTDGAPRAGTDGRVMVAVSRVEAGDDVLGRDGKPHTVSATAPAGNGRVTLTYDDGATETFPDNLALAAKDPASPGAAEGVRKVPATQVEVGDTIDHGKLVTGVRVEGNDVVFSTYGGVNADGQRHPDNGYRVPRDQEVTVQPKPDPAKMSDDELALEMEQIKPGANFDDISDSVAQRYSKLNAELTRRGGSANVVEDDLEDLPLGDNNMPVEDLDDDALEEAINALLKTGFDPESEDGKLYAQLWTERETRRNRSNDDGEPGEPEHTSPVGAGGDVPQGGEWGEAPGSIDDGVDRSTWTGGQPPGGFDGSGTRPDGTAWGSGYPEGDPRLDPAYDQYTADMDAKLDAGLEKYGDTEALLDKVDGAPNAYQPDRHAVHDQIIDDIMATYADIPRENRAVIMAGPPGAGKTTVIIKSGSEFGVTWDEAKGRPGNYAVVNPDDMKDELIKRGLIPAEYDEFGLAPAEMASFIHEESSWLAERLLTRLKADGVNLILDGTFAGKPDKQVGKVHTLRGDGYSVKGILVDGTVSRSLANAGGRHRKAPAEPGGRYGGRYVPMGHIKGNEPETDQDSSVFGRPHKNRSSENIERAQDAFDEGVAWYDNSTGESKKIHDTFPAEEQALTRRMGALQTRIGLVSDPAVRAALQREYDNLVRYFEMEFDSLATAWLDRGGADLEAKVLDLLAEQPEVKAEGGADRNRGGAEQLRRYWVRGEGAAKIGWGTDGDWSRCVALVSEHMDPERAKGYCNLRHTDALGHPPGQGHKTLRAVASARGAVADAPALDALEGAGAKGSGEGQVVTVAADGASGVTTLQVDGAGDGFKVRDANAQDDPAQVVYVEVKADGSLRLLPSHTVRALAPVLPVAVGKGAAGPEQAGTKVGAEGGDRSFDGVVVERKIGEQGSEWVAVPRGPSVVALAEPAAEASGRVTPIIEDSAGGHDDTVAWRKWLGKVQRKDVPTQQNPAGENTLPNTNPEQTGVMVALYPADDIVSALALDGGEAANDLHITLAFLGNVDELGDPQRLIDAVAALAKRQGDVHAMVSGLGRWDAGEDGDAFVALIDGPEVDELRREVCTAVEAIGKPARDDHGFTPHITLAYLTAEDPTPVERIAALPATFQFLSVAIGEDVYDFPLSADDDGQTGPDPSTEGEGDAPYDGDANATTPRV